MVKVDIACGQNKREGFIGIDIAPAKEVDIVHNLNVYPWPFEDNEVDEFNCSHYIEHIKHDDVLTDIKSILNDTTSFDEFKNKVLDLKSTDGFIKFIDEIYRILKPGGVINIVVPYVTHVRSYGDPTHTRYMHDMSFYYCNKEWRETNRLDHYDMECDFDIKFSYQIGNELTLKSKVVREEMIANNWNTVTDLIVELTKR